MNAWHIQHQGASKGPFSDEQLKTLCETGTVTAATLVWKEGFADWVRLADTDYIYKGMVPPFGAPSQASFNPQMSVLAGLTRSAPVDAEPELGFFQYGWRALTTKYATFSGRARRKEYWAYAVIYLLVLFAAGFVGGFIDAASGNLPEQGGQMVFGPVLIILAVVALLLPGIAVSVRRLHDLGMTGWWALILIIPYIGGLIFLVFSVLPGQPHANAYGPPPKQPV